MTDKYSSYEELKGNETEGVYYKIYTEDRSTRTAIVAIHGGRIETGTSEIARGIAGEDQMDDHPDYSPYLFEGLKPPGQNSDLHITSTVFDEPWAQYMVEQTTQVISVHGDSGSEEIVYVGGLDEFLRDAMIEALGKAGFDAQIAPNSGGKESLKSIRQAKEETTTKIGSEALSIYETGFYVCAPMDEDG